MKFIDTSISEWHRGNDDGLPIDLFQLMSKAMIKAHGKNASMEEILPHSGIAVHIEGGGQRFSVDGASCVYPAKDHLFIVLERDAILTFNDHDGATWYVHNHPVHGAIISAQPFPARSKNEELSPVTSWLLNGERGASSEAMCFHLFGREAKFRPQGHKIDYPCDPSDFRRCRLFVEATGCRDRVGEMAKVSPIWAMYVERWDELCEMMDAEVGWMKGNQSGSATKTFAAMRAMQSICAENGETDLHSAAYGQLEFIGRKTNMDRMERIVSDRVNMIHALVKYGVNVNAIYQPTGLTALANAVSRVTSWNGKIKPYHTAVIEALVKCGADVNAKTTLAGLTVAQQARNSDNAEVLCRALGISLSPDDDCHDAELQGKSRQKMKV